MTQINISRDLYASDELEAGKFYLDSRGFLCFTWTRTYILVLNDPSCRVIYAGAAGSEGRFPFQRAPGHSFYVTED